VTNHDPHKIGAVRRRHEIDKRRSAGFGLEFGFEDERAGAITSTYSERGVLRSNEPQPIIGCP
jgi:hypothetical protein